MVKLEYIGDLAGISSVVYHTPIANFERPHYGRLVIAALAIPQHIATIFVFIPAVIHIREQSLDPRMVIWVVVLAHHSPRQKHSSRCKNIIWPMSCSTASYRHLTDEIARIARPWDVRVHTHWIPSFPYLPRLIKVNNLDLQLSSLFPLA